MKAAGVVLYNSARLVQHKQVENTIKMTKSFKFSILFHQSAAGMSPKTWK